MRKELEPEDQQVDLLNQVIQKLEEIRIAFERNHQKADPVHEWPWIDGRQLEKLLGLHERTLATWRENGTLAFTKIGKKIFYNKKDIEQLLWNKFSREVKL